MRLIAERNHVALLDFLEGKILSAVEKFFEPILKPLNKLWTALKSFFTALIDLIPESISLFKLVTSEVVAWKNFKKGINFKTGVINLQSAKDRIQDLIDEIVNAWQAFLGIWRGAKLNPLDQINEASQALADVLEEFANIGRFGEFLKNVGPKIEKVGGKVFEVLAIIQQVAELLLDVVRKLSTIITAIKDVRETFQTGEGLFLKQTNKRKSLELMDGTKISVRLGALHQ